MENKEIIGMLDAIINYLNREEYEKARDYIHTKKAEITKKIDPVSEYMDKLVENLK